MRISEIQLYNALKTKLDDRKDTFLNKDDKIDIMRSIYIVGIVQFLAIVGSVLAIMNFMVRK
jgi:hypothetical protein